MLSWVITKPEDLTSVLPCSSLSVSKPTEAAALGRGDSPAADFLPLAGNPLLFEGHFPIPLLTLLLGTRGIPPSAWLLCSSLPACLSVSLCLGSIRDAEPPGILAP
jgi:hypothetical protein